jgi:hypothetical protein
MDTKNLKPWLISKYSVEIPISLTIFYYITERANSENLMPKKEHILGANFTLNMNFSKKYLIILKFRPDWHEIKNDGTKTLI